MRKVFKYCVISIIGLSLIICLYIHFAPVSFDVDPCSGGYSRWISDKYTEEWAESFLKQNGYDKGTEYKVISTEEEIISSINWEGRIINSTIKIEIDNNINELKITGKRYWIEKYNWKIECVNKFV